MVYKHRSLLISSMVMISFPKIEKKNLIPLSSKSNIRKSVLSSFTVCITHVFSLSLKFLVHLCIGLVIVMEGKSVSLGLQVV